MTFWIDWRAEVMDVVLALLVALHGAVLMLNWMRGRRRSAAFNIAVIVIISLSAGVQRYSLRNLCAAQQKLIQAQYKLLQALQKGPQREVKGMDAGPVEERGRELKVTELKRGQVVVIQPPGANYGITMWVREVGKGGVCFYSGELKWMVLNSYDQHGVIHDGRGGVVKVYEYLGKI